MKVINQLLVIVLFLFPAVICSMLLVGWKRVRDFSKVEPKKEKNQSKKIRRDFYALLSEIKSDCKKKNKICVKILPVNLINPKNDLGFSGTPFCLRTIAYTPVAIKHYAINPPIWKIAIVQSIGHEIAHWWDIRRNKFHKEQPKESQHFFYWVHEVRCDFYGVNFAMSFDGDYSREEIITAIEKKAEVYKQNSDYKPGHRKRHPSWEFRLEMLRSHTSFDEEVIKAIKQAAECNDDTYVDFVARNLREIAIE